MLKFDTAKGAARLAGTERVPLFSIDDTEYTIPKNVDMTVALRYLDTVAEKGTEVGIVGLFKELVGEQAWQALLGFKGMDPAELNQLLEAVTEHAMGAIEAAKGK